MNDFLEDYQDNKQDEDKELLIDKIKELFTEVQNKHASEDEEERQWIIEKCQNPKILELLQETTFIMIHVLDAVGRYSPVNTITISKKTNIPKGTVSKITRKLIDKELILKEALPNNKKEFVFNITPLGKEIFVLHEELHKKIDTKINKFFKRYDVNELQFLTSVFEDFLKL